MNPKIARVLYSIAVLGLLVASAAAVVVPFTVVHGFTNYSEPKITQKWSKKAWDYEWKVQWEAARDVNVRFAQNHVWFKEPAWFMVLSVVLLLFGSFIYEWFQQSHQYINIGLPDRKYLDLRYALMGIAVWLVVMCAGLLCALYVNATIDVPSLMGARSVVKRHDLEHVVRSAFGDFNWELGLGVFGAATMVWLLFIVAGTYMVDVMIKAGNGWCKALIKKGQRKFADAKNSLKLTASHVEVYRPYLKVRLIPFPSVTLIEKPAKTMPVADFWHAVSQGCADEVAPEAQQVLAQDIADRLERVDLEVEARFRRKVAKVVTDAVKRRAVNATRARLNGKTEQAQALLQQTVDRVSARFKQDLIAQVSEIAEDDMTSFKKIVADGLRGRIIDTHDGSSRTLSTRLPLGTRFVGTYGGRTMVVVETEPMERTLLWNRAGLEADLQNLKKGGVEVTADMKERAQRATFNVALPYCVYVMLFDGNRFVDMHLFCRTAPLRSFEDDLYVLPLPHFREDDAQVCLGEEFKVEQESMAHAAEHLIAYFWNSEFVFTHWDRWYRHAVRIHPKLKHIWAWEDATAEDPRFILEGTFPRAGDKCTHTLSSLWKKLCFGALNAELITYDVLVERSLQAGYGTVEDAMYQAFAQASVQEVFPRTVATSMGSYVDGVVASVIESIDVDVIGALYRGGPDDALRLAFNRAFVETIVTRVCHVLPQTEIQRAALTVDMNKLVARLAEPSA